MLSEEELLKLEKFYRYFDKGDGDGIGYRTLPGVHPKGAYFTRGSGHTQYGTYTEDSAEYQIVLDRLLKKWETAKKLVPRAIIDATAGSDIGLVSIGSCDGAIHEALAVLRERGVGVDYMRVRAFPFSEDVERLPRAPGSVRGGAESGRAVQVPADARDGGGEIEAALLTPLQWPADLIRASSWRACWPQAPPVPQVQPKDAVRA